MQQTDATTRRVRAAHRLNALKVMRAKTPGLYENGAGLRLVITDQGTKRCTVRVTIRGRRVERGLGVFLDVSLDEARKQAAIMRQAAREGRDIRDETRSRHRTARDAVWRYQGFRLRPRRRC
jgi:hypothetical protein